ncbi:MAG TPA: hypothetical protein DCQ91_02345 [Porphyromonadaceae bacterium]|nr:hypothetical protein [Porphyromonadaceae bacterium]
MAQTAKNDNAINKIFLIVSFFLNKILTKLRINDHNAKNRKRATTFTERLLTQKIAPRAWQSKHILQSTKLV